MGPLLPSWELLCDCLTEEPFPRVHPQLVEGVLVRSRGSPFGPPQKQDPERIVRQVFGVRRGEMRKVLFQKLSHQHFWPASLLLLEDCRTLSTFARGTPFFFHCPQKKLKECVCFHLQDFGFGGSGCQSEEIASASLFEDTRHMSCLSFFFLQIG